MGSEAPRGNAPGALWKRCLMPPLCPMRGPRTNPAGAGSATRFCDPSAQGPSCCQQHLGDLCFVPARGSSCCAWLQPAGFSAPDLGTGAAGAEFPVRALGGAGQGCPEHGAGLQHSGSALEHPTGAVSSSPSSACLNSPFPPLPGAVARRCEPRGFARSWWQRQQRCTGRAVRAPVQQREHRARAERPKACAGSGTCLASSPRSLSS